MKCVLPLLMCLSTSCIMSPTVGLPAGLLVIGQISAATGGAMMIAGNFHPDVDSRVALVGIPLALAGMVLDAEDTGRQIALNPIPLSQVNARRLGVDLEDLEEYNDVDLPQILETNALIEKTVLEISREEIPLDEALKDLAHHLGVAGSLIDVIKGDKMSKSQLAAFAAARGISQRSAKIYLTTRWSVKF